MSRQALCQDCLRALTFATEDAFEQAHLGIVKCLCGGELCGCESCMASLAALAAGEFENAGLVGDISKIESWTADGGLVESQGVQP